MDFYIGLGKNVKVIKGHRPFNIILDVYVTLEKDMDKKTSAIT